MRFPISERVERLHPEPGDVVNHRRYGWRGTVALYAHEPPRLMVIWLEGDKRGASLAEIGDLEVAE